MKKVLWGVASAVMLVAGAWAGGSAYVGMKIEDSLKQAAAEPPGGQDQSWRLRDVQHDRGLLRSSGQASVVYSPGCAAGVDDAGFTVKVTYTLDHLVTREAARFQWQLAPQGATAGDFKALFGAASGLVGHGTVGFDGAVYSDMSLPGVSLRRPGEVLEITPSVGKLEIHGQRLGMRWQTDRAAMRGEGEALVLEGVAINLALDDRRKGTGIGRIDIVKAGTQLGSFQGLALTIDARENGDRLDMSVEPSVSQLEAGGLVLTDLRMQWALKGVHTASVERLIRLFEESCGTEALTLDERKAAAATFETVLAKGFSVGIPRLTGKAAQGSLDGSFIAELAGATGGSPSLTEQLRASGRLEIKGEALTPDQQQMAIGMGLAVAQSDGLAASFEYAKGIVKVNGRAVDATAVEERLMQADESLRAALDELRSPPEASLPTSR